VPRLKPRSRQKKALLAIRWHDRLFLAGQSGSGKSEVLNYLFSRLQCQKILLDTKGEFAIDHPKTGQPIQPARSVDAIDWAAPVIHFQEMGGDLDAYDELCYEVLHRRNVVICCHELADLCDDLPNRTPKWVRQGIRKGNVFGDGWLSASQRPVGMPRQARSEAVHVLQMVPALDPEDHKIVASMMGVPDHELHRHIADAAALSPTGQFSFVWRDRRERTLSIWPPLPEPMRAGIIVRRTANV
jgi:hypothetical protein